MTSITKEELIKKFADSFVCVVTYKGSKTSIEYSTAKNVAWKKVQKLTVLFNKPKQHICKGESVTRPGVAYLLKGN